MTRPHNKALHQTRRQGVPASRAVVEGRLAGEGRCYADPEALPRELGAKLDVPLSKLGVARVQAVFEEALSRDRPPNQALHQTGREGVPASRAVVEARLAAEARCFAGKGAGQ